MSEEVKDRTEVEEVAEAGELLGRTDGARIRRQGEGRRTASLPKLNAMCEEQMGQLTDSSAKDENTHTQSTSE